MGEGEPRDEKRALTYREAGVDIAAGDEAVRLIVPLAESTKRPGVLAGIGGFAGAFRPAWTQYHSPILLAATDGVGTKLKIAQAMGIHHTVGIDCVAMVVNDLAADGAEPLFFLDYIGVGRLDPAQVASLVEGVAAGCRLAGCALLGGETAEMPGVYAPGEYDLVGFGVGIREEEKTGDGPREGDVLLGLSSSGLHSNGYSLVRRVFLDREDWSLDRRVPELDCTLGDELLKPTRVYARTVSELWRDGLIAGAAHITGGGLVGNVPRMLPAGLVAHLNWGSWPVPPVFDLVRRVGGLGEGEMRSAFNLGLGMVLCVHPEEVDEVSRQLARAKERCLVVGQVRAAT